MIFSKLKSQNYRCRNRKNSELRFDARQRAIQLEKNANSYSLQLTAVFYQNLI